MTHISSIGAGLFSDLSVGLVKQNPVGLSAPWTKEELAAMFTTQAAPTDNTPVATEFISIAGIREFPPVGTPSNIVNVPGYGSATSLQIQGQADASSFELQINYTGTQWDKANYPGKMVNDGNAYPIRLAILNSRPPGLASSPAGLGAVENSIYYFIGKLEAIAVQPSLTDANIATLTLSVQSQFYGAFTINP
jgi:hypothetical protein